METVISAGPPNRRYSVIYADPPWAWTRGVFRNRGSARTVEKEYATMQPNEIAALPVAEWSGDDAVLFLWATGPKLPIALQVMTAWGFIYKTIGFTWIKQNKSGQGLFWGLGFYTRANAELCLVGTRGNPRRKSAGIHQVVMSPVAKHSEKPDEVRNRIEALYDGPYLEMFARSARPGWISWGLEAPDHILDVRSAESRRANTALGSAKQCYLA